MAFDIAIYRAERDAGLAAKIRSQASVAYASAVCVSAPFVVSERVMATLRELAKAGARDEDLHYIRDIMVSTVWNNNDDVFDPIETWIARASPEHKPLNIGHVGTDIVGHIIQNEPIDEEGKVIAADTVLDDLPAKFHIATGSVIYKFWEDPEQQKRVDELLQQITKGEKFVSMECLFKGFDYALKGSDGKSRVLARNEQTAFLTKHLRAYGGDGHYGDYRVGRLLRNILFSGKGLVDKPANPESVIFAEGEAFNASKAEILTEFPRSFAEQVYKTFEPQKQESHPIMAVELTDLQKQIDALKSENEQLKAAAKASDIKDLTSAKEKAEAAVAELTKKLADQAQASTKTAEELKATQTKLAEAEKTLAEVKDELRGIREAEKQATRIEKIKAAMKVTAGEGADLEGAAKEMADSLVTLSDGEFDKYLAGQTKFFSVAFPPKLTPAQERPGGVSPTKVEGKAEMNGHPPETIDKTGASDATQDPAAKNADPAVLDQAKAGNEPALSTPVQDDGVNSVQKDICDFFSVSVEDEQ